MMKKIITSAAVAVALSAAAYAASTGAYNGGTTISYNTVAVAETAVDINNSDLVYTSDFNFNANDFIIVKLTGGAEFTDVDNYAIYDGETQVAELFTATSASELKFRVSADELIVRNGNYTIRSGEQTNTTITLAEGSTGDVTAQITATDGFGTAISVATANIDMLEAQTHNITLSLDCGTNPAVVDSETRNQFIDLDDGYVGSDWAECNVKVTDPSAAADIDFDYEDANFTYDITGINFADGVVYAGTEVSQSTTGADSVRILTDNEPIYYGEDYVGFGLDEDAANLDTVQMYLTVTANYGSVDANGDYTIDLENASLTLLEDKEAMGYVLTTYKANVLNLRANATGSVNTFMKIYNNSDAETTVKATITNPDGTEIVLENVKTIGAGGSETVSMLDFKTANSSVANGAQVDLTMPIDAKSGDVVAFMNDATGKTGVRVVDNNEKSKGM